MKTDVPDGSPVPLSGLPPLRPLLSSVDLGFNSAAHSTSALAHDSAAYASSSHSYYNNVAAVQSAPLCFPAASQYDYSRNYANELSSALDIGLLAGLQFSLDSVDTHSPAVFNTTFHTQSAAAATVRLKAPRARNQRSKCSTVSQQHCACIIYSFARVSACARSCADCILLYDALCACVFACYAL